MSGENVPSSPEANPGMDAGLNKMFIPHRVRQGDFSDYGRAIAKVIEDHGMGTAFFIDIPGPGRGLITNNHVIDELYLEENVFSI